MLDIESSALIDLIKNERGAGNPALKSQLAEVAEECERSGKTAFEIIENYGILNREQMLELMADNLGSYVWDPTGGASAVPLLSINGGNVSYLFQDGYRNIVDSKGEVVTHRQYSPYGSSVSGDM